MNKYYYSMYPHAVLLDETMFNHYCLKQFFLVQVTKHL